MPRIKIDETIGETPKSPRVTVKKVDKTEKMVPVVVVPPIKTGVEAELAAVSGKSILAAFSAYPAGVVFSGQEEAETIVLLLRAHIITNVPWILGVIGLILVPIIIFPFLFSLSVLPPIGVGAGVFVTLLWYAGVFTYAFVNFLYWYFNIYLVTTERVVDVDWYSLVNQKVSSTGISHIEDVSATRGGVLSSIFDYGNIFIQTAGTEENFEFISVPHPQLIVKKLEGLMQKEEGELEAK